MSSLLIVWLFLCLIFLGVPGVYYLYLRRMKSRPWNLKIDKSFLPSITILVPTYNEANVIGFKLRNLHKLKYSKDLTQIIVIDSASKDNTLDEVFKFVEDHPELDVQVLKEDKRSGKSRALNVALKYATGNVIIVSDADSFLPSDILLNSLSLLSDPLIGAVGGREMFLNSSKSWVTLSESSYLDFMDVVKLGESKIHSTIFFEGGFSAYKREFLDEFDSRTGSDDCGTALRIIQKKARAIFAPEATFFTVFPVTWKGKLSIKIRRASQLVRIWIECLRLLLHRRLFVPKKIALAEMFIYLINPVVFVLLVFTTSALVLEYLPYSLVFLLIPLLGLLIPKFRFLFIDFLQSNCILLGALMAFVLGRKFTVWNTPEELRSLLTREMLEEKNLI